jgi:hypothetical protein
MACLLGKTLEECALHPAVAVEEGMNGVQFVQVFGGARGELIRAKATQ